MSRLPYNNLGMSPFYCPPLASVCVLLGFVGYVIGTTLWGWWDFFKMVRSLFVFCVLVVIVFDGVSSVKCSGFGALIKYTKNIGLSPNPNKRDQKRKRMRSHVALWTNPFTLFSWVCQTAAFHAIDMDFTSKRPLLYLNRANNWVMVYYGCY